MDVSTSISVTITTLKVNKVPLKAQGPIGKGLSALLIGRSSATFQGIYVHPGVIDADFTGQIHRMVSIPTAPVPIPEKNKIALIMPLKSCVPNTDARVQVDQGFGSTGEPQVFWIQVVDEQRTNMVCIVMMPQSRPSQIKVLRDPTRKDALLDFLLVNRETLMSEVVIGDHFGHSEHEGIEFKISVDRRKSASKTSALDMRRADFRREIIHTTFYTLEAIQISQVLFTEGNARADHLASPAWTAPQPDMMAQAKASHDFFHQGVGALQRPLLSNTEAHNIVNTCADCQGHTAPPQMGVKPRGLKALQISQTDVTHITKFGRLKYVHVSIDTFSSAIRASVHSGEKGWDAIAHWRLAFAALGISHNIKTENGPAYTSQKTRQFLQLWGVSHQTGVPHLATGQVIIECAHGTLKRILDKQKEGMCSEIPQSRVAKAVYTLNHFTVPEQSQNPVILNHFLSLQSSGDAQSPKPKVMVKDITNKWEGPWYLITWECGYACVSTDTRTRWIPARCVCPALCPVQDQRYLPDEAPADVVEQGVK
ncbi:hypothetical protein HGM15179_019421 [Zosterops borbonicus]|uniref:RNA-directed DNA polymerase n=1 Tax=Zosterops borbonicus TaxID=364589 RepID=A0A8K1FVZ3_9PASS|nr:hypothetical protein HGM15179_019421 [Zosterops borbonicus]